MGEETKSARLTERELEVAVLLGRGLTLKEIAARMGIARTTVSRHLYNACGSCGARSTAQLAVMVAVRRERDRVRKEAAIPVEGTVS